MAQAVTGFSPPRPRFNPRVSHLEFVVGLVFLQPLWFLSALATSALY